MMTASTLARSKAGASGRAGRRTGLDGDRAFRALVTSAGVGLLVAVAAMFAFLLVEAVPALRANTGSFWTETQWLPDTAPSVFGVAALVWGTLVSSAVALVIATPTAVAVALFTTHYARRSGRVLGYAVDLLAAVPSVVFGLWGISYLVPALQPVQALLARLLGWIPVFDAGLVGRSLFAAGVVLAVMVLPIISSFSRDVLMRVPSPQVEAALALGATRWETMRVAVLPYAARGIVSAAMLGLGRALGETIAIAMVLSASYSVSVHILEPGGVSIAGNIANAFNEAGDIGRGALIASGLVLFAITFVVNGLARTVLNRRGTA